jgi:membrane protease YdiL (CAAX protease family)
VAPEIMGIVIGSTFKGVIVGLIAGFFARRVSSLPLGVAVGLAAGLLFAWLIASQPDPATGKHYYWEIMLPGSLAGAIVGYATQRYGRRPGAART